MRAASIICSFGHAGYRLHEVGGVLGQGRLPLLEALGALGDELLVGQALVEDDLGHAVEEGDVGARFFSKPEVGVVAQLDALRVDDYELGAVQVDGLAKAGGGDGVVGARVTAGDDQAAGLFVVEI